MRIVRGGDDGEDFRMRLNQAQYADGIPGRGENCAFSAFSLVECGIPRSSLLFRRCQREIVKQR